MRKLLLVEDDPKLSSMLETYLGEHGFKVTCAPTLADAREQTGKNGFDIIALDLMLPDGDGMDFCRELRAKTDTPVVMLTARGDEMDRIVGLEIGADDYIPKPFNPRELVARLRAVLRRSGERPAPVGVNANFGDVEIDFGSMEVRKAGKSAPLTSHQFALLRELVESAGIVLSRDRLMDAVRGTDMEAFDRSIDVHISRIRAAIEDNPKQPRYIKTVRGAGYVFSMSPDKE